MQSLLGRLKYPRGFKRNYRDIVTHIDGYTMEEYSILLWIGSIIASKLWASRSSGDCCSPPPSTICTVGMPAQRRVRPRRTVRASTQLSSSAWSSATRCVSMHLRNICDTAYIALLAQCPAHKSVCSKQ